MKKITKIWTCILLAAAFAIFALCALAASYSSAEDPLISLSYINEVLLPQIGDMIENAVSGKDVTLPEVTAPPVTTEAPATTEAPEVTYPAGTVNTGSRFETVNLKKGQTLYASVSSCEVIVRSGNTKVVSPFTVKNEEQGVSDTTDGKELLNGADIPKNHTIIIPRDDGRGIETLAGGAWIMVRGDYIIK